MSLLALIFDKVNPVAEFYAGYAEKTVGVSMRHELHKCMERDDELTYVWDQAITALNHKGGKDEWMELKDKAFGMSIPLLADCQESGKFRAVMPEIDAWWTDVYGAENSLEMIEENFSEHKFGVILNMMLMRAQWEFGFYHAAGKSFGRFDRMLLGRPQWTAIKAAEPVQAVVQKKDHGSGKDLVHFQSFVADHMMGTNNQKAVAECVTPDDVEMKIMDVMIKALNPYDEFNVTKYIETVSKMDEFNWIPCLSNKEIKAMVDESEKFQTTFWRQPNVDEIVKANVTKHWKEFETNVFALQKTWANGDYEKAAYHYAKYWSFIQDHPLPKK